MARYIDADMFDDTVLTLNERGWNITRGEYKLMDGVLFEMPTADVVEVVRCKNCDWLITTELKADGTTDKRYKPTWCTLHNEYMNDNDFCSYGERREQ